MPSNDDVPLRTAGFDPRFPNTNQSYNCYWNYVDFYRCEELLIDRNQDDICQVFKDIFTSICPNAWIERWDRMREEGNFPYKIVQVPKAPTCDKF